MTVHERIYRSLLVVYPSEHRHEYAEPMTQLLRDRLREEGGGVRTVQVWADVAWDLARTALSERTETTMQWFKSGWWRFAAALVAPILALLGIGNLEDDGGPLYGRVVAATIAIIAALLIVAGLAVRRRNRALGGGLIAVGVLPGTLLVVFFWFPPVALMGILCVAVLLASIADVVRSGRPAEASG